MLCPFLREARVGQCSLSALKVMVVRAPLAGQERCSSPDYVSCPAYRESPEAGAPAVSARCPYLDDTPMQYCSAAAVAKYIRPSQSLLSRCGNDRHRYCDVFVALATAGRAPGDAMVDHIPVPGRLCYAPNHMWLDPGDNGTCFIGIDGFLATVLGQVERLRFPNPSGLRRPAAVVTVRGVDLELVFPRALLITGVHNYLRADPAALTRDPYGQGWLFECRRGDIAGLLEGENAIAWMQSEVDRMSQYVHNHLARISPSLTNDGGTFGADLMENLSRDEAVKLFDEFFPPGCGEETHS